MIWVRKGFVHLLAIVLLFALLGGASSVAFNKTFTNSEKVKGWLAESGLYDNVVDSTLDNASSDGEQEGSVDLNNPEVQAAAKKAFSQQFIASSVNTFIDGNYAWLQGKTTTPSFSIDLTAPKQAFAENVGQLVEAHLAALKVCTAEQQAKLQLPVDPLAVVCRPANIDPKTEGARVTQEINDSKLADQGVITADSLNKESGGEPYYQSLKKAPQVYSVTQKLPLIFAAVALISALGVYFIAITRRRGLRRIGMMFLDAGILLILAKFTSSFINDKMISSLNENEALKAGLRQSYIKLLNDLTGSVFSTTVLFGIVFLLLAAAIFIYLFVTRDAKPKVPKTKKQEAAPETPTNTTPRPQPSNQPVAPRPRPITDLRPKPTQSQPPITPGTAPALKKPRPRRPRLIQ